MAIKFAVDVQREVINLTLDDVAPASMFPELLERQSEDMSDSRRERVIEFLCLMLKAGLIVPIRGMERYREKSVAAIEHLLRVGDLSNGLDANLFWNAIHFEGTPELKAAMDGMRLRNWEALRGDCSTDLRNFLAQSGVTVE